MEQGRLILEQRRLIKEQRWLILEQGQLICRKVKIRKTQAFSSAVAWLGFVNKPNWVSIDRFFPKK